MVIEKVQVLGMSVRKYARSIGFMSLALLGANGSNGADMAGVLEGGPEFIPGRYIVTFKTKSQRGMVSREVESVRKRPGVKMQHIYSNALNGFAADLSDEALESLKHDPRVESIEQDQIVRIDQRRGGSGGGGSSSSSSQIVPWGISRIGLGYPSG